MRENNVFYVYEWFIEETNEVFYVGKGKGNRAGSIKQNKFFKDMYNTHECNYRIIKDNITEDEAFKYEEEMILYYRNNFPNYRLTNMTNGGEGVSGWIPDENFRIKQSKIHKELWGNVEYKNRMLKIRKDENGVYKSKEFRDKISSMVRKENNPNYANYWSDEQKDNMRKKMLGRYDKENNPNYNNKWTDDQKLHLSNIRKNPKYNNENHGMAKTILCLETCEIFDCIKYCKLKYPGATSIYDNRKIARGYHFMPINDDYKIDKEEIRLKLIDFYKQISKPSYIIYICLETYEIIISKSELLKRLNIGVKIFNKSIKKDGYIHKEGFTYIDIKNYSPYMQQCI